MALILARLATVAALASWGLARGLSEPGRPPPARFPAGRQGQGGPGDAGGAAGGWSRGVRRASALTTMSWWH